MKASNTFKLQKPGVQPTPTNSSNCVLKLRLLINQLINEVESLEERSLSVPLLSLTENCDSINFYDEVERFECALIRSALRRTNGHQIRAARILNLHPSTLNAKIKQYEIR